MRKEKFVSLALSYVGFSAINYGKQFFDNSIKSFKCAEFVSSLLKKAKYPNPIPTYVNEFFDSFGILIHEQFREAGDLVFFAKRGGIYPGHIGIMVSRHEYIHLPRKNGRIICLNRFEQKIIKSKNEIKQIYFSNPIGIKRITVKNGRYQQIFLK